MIIFSIIMHIYLITMSTSLLIISIYSIIIMIAHLVYIN